MKISAPKSITKQVKRMERDLSDASETYNDIINVAGPAIQHIAEGQKLLAHARSERASAFRVKTDVRMMREGMKQEGWFEKNIFPLLKRKSSEVQSITRYKNKVVALVQDSVNTSAAAAKIMRTADPAMDNKLPAYEDSTVYEELPIYDGSFVDPQISTITATALMTITEEHESEEPIEIWLTNSYH